MKSCRTMTAALALSSLAFNCCADGKQWGHLSDALALGLPALAAGYSLLQQDQDGARQLAWSLGSTLVSTEILKSQIHEMRPDRSGDDSMPSGHTALAFAAARYLQKRTDSDVNPWLLYGAASLTAVARVKADKHYWKDTVAGAALGYGWASYFTEGRNGERISLMPLHRGVAFAWQSNW